MSHDAHFKLSPKRARPLERPLHEAGSHVSAAHLNAEQRYRVERTWHHNRFLHGEGVVCGLQVVPAHVAARRWAVRVCPGYAIGCCGEEIEVRSAALLDIREFLWNRPLENGHPARDAFVAIRHAGELVKPRAAEAARCGCDDATYQPSRVRDGYRLVVLWANTEDRKPPFDLCVPAVASCPVCSGRADVVLARVTLPEHESRPIESEQIDNAVRRRQVATSALARELAACCCANESPEET
jgi:hypothetical protein